MKNTTYIHILIATGFGTGFSPFAPGTAGALLAALIWAGLYCLIPFNLLWILTALLIVVFTIAGIWSANAMEKAWGKDPSRVVVDEMVGVWIALLAVPEGSYLVSFALAAFILFRLFDIFKPLGIRKMESFKGGVGIMMDDILAGIYTFMLLMGTRCLIA